MRARTPALVLILTSLLGAAAGADAQAPPVPSITVTGTATVSARPDTAELSVGVVTQAPTATAALADNTVAMQRVLKLIADLGIASRDVKTESIRIAPQRPQPQPGRAAPPDIVGYEVSNRANVTVRDLSLLGRLLDGLVAQGANTLGGIAFSIADPAPLLQQARAAAIADARRRAEVYTTAAGVKLGRVLLIHDQTAGPPRPMAARMMAAAPVPVAPGEQDIEASVSVTYAIE
jgi:uncharacterized protein YggE